jgi:hypothetical protein
VLDPPAPAPPPEACSSGAPPEALDVLGDAVFELQPSKITPTAKLVYRLKFATARSFAELVRAQKPLPSYEKPTG